MLKRYREGLDNYLTVINVLQELRTVQRNFVTAQLTLINARIDFFRAIGDPIVAQATLELI